MIRLKKAAGFGQSLTAELVDYISQREAVGAFVARGTCLEGQGVQDGDVLCVSFKHIPERDELCLCRLDGIKRFYPVFKQYLQTNSAGLHTVTTSHADAGKNKTYQVKKIYGTVIAQIRNGVTLWSNPILDKPADDPPRFARMELDWPRKGENNHAVL